MRIPVKSSLLLCLFLGLFVQATPVFAHAAYVRSEPPANSAQKVPPTQVRIWFSEAVEPSFSNIRVLDKNGVPFDKQDSHRFGDDPTAISVTVGDLPQGLYTVAWKSASAVDAHVTQGSFAFTVGDVPLSDSAPRELMALVDSTLSANARPPISQVIVRWLNIVLLALLVGNLSFPLLVLLPALKATRTKSDAWVGNWLRITRLTFVSLALATVALLVLQAFTVGSDLNAILRVLVSTRFGTVWLFRVALLSALGFILFRQGSDFHLSAANLLGILLLVTQSLNSHNAAVNDPPLVPLLTDMVHLAGSAVWFGGLVLLLITLPALLRPLKAEERPRVLSNIISRFSLVALVAVGAIALTGAYSMVLQVGSLDALFNTLYGTALVVKLILVFLLLAAAGTNLVVTRPAAAQALAQHLTPLVRRFNAAVALEVMLILGLLLAVGVMTSTAPAKSAYSPSPSLWIETHYAEDLSVTLAVAPALIGANDFDVKLQNASGQPVSSAALVRLLVTAREMDMGTQQVEATNQGNGHYTLRGDLLSMVGTWQFQVLVRRLGVEDVRTVFSLLALPSPLLPQPPLLVLSTEAQMGLGLTLFALAIGTAGALFIRKRNMRLITLGMALAVSLVGAIVVFQTAASAPTAPAVVIPVAPPSARILRSPIAPTANQLAAGRQIYQENCASCHGTDGKGNGPAAVNLNPRPFDLTVHARLHTEGELYYWVTNGIPGTAMAAWQMSLSDIQRWQVVQFIRTLGTSTPVSPAGEAAR